MKLFGGEYKVGTKKNKIIALKSDIEILENLRGTNPKIESTRKNMINKFKKTLKELETK